MNRLGFASITAVQQYLRYANEVGLDCGAALDASELDRSILFATQGRVRGEWFQALIAHLMQQADDPLFGLHTSQQVQSESYDLIGMMSLSCATLGEAVGLTVPYERLVGDMGITTIRFRYGHVFQSWHPAYSLSHVRTQMIDNVLASWTQYARWLAQQPLSPERVLLERKPPSQAEISQYEAFYACPVLFEQPENTLVFSQSLMDLPLAHSGEQRLASLTALARKELGECGQPEQRLSVRTQNLIRRQLRYGSAQKPLVAHELNMSERTLQRKLHAEGHSYQQLLDQVREGLAEEMIADEQLSFEEIAHNLGFAELRCLSRRFQAWKGCTLNAYRMHLRQANDQNKTQYNLVT